MAAPHNLKDRLQSYAVKKRYQEAESSKKEVFSSVSDNFKDSGALSTIVVLVVQHLIKRMSSVSFPVIVSTTAMLFL